MSGRVTDSRDDRGVVERLDAGRCDCVRCGTPIGPTDPVCILDRDGNEPQSFEPFCEVCASRAINLLELRACEVCGRPMHAHKERVCSRECRSQLPAVRRARARFEARTSVTPEHFDCERCGTPIEGTVVFWWNDKWGRGRAHDRTWCEPCWAAMRAEEDRGRCERSGGEPDILGTVPPNPDAEGYDPFARIGRFEPTPCGACGRSIRWGHPRGFCCERCAYEDEKASRRVKRREKTCEVCGEPFTPRRSDAKTCSDRCRQARRRSRLAASSRRPAARGPQTNVTGGTG